MATQTRYASKDAHMGKAIGGSFSGWNGKDNHLPVGVSFSGDYKYRSCVYFNIDFSPMLSITSATLYLYNHETGSNLHANQTATPTQMHIYRMTADWGEGTTDPGEGGLTSTLAWDWDNRYNKFTTSGSVTQNVTQDGEGNGSEESFDVTDIVTSWFNGSNNYGFMLVSDNETNSSRGLQFYSRSEDASGDNRPKLVVTYTTNTAPNPPNLTSPVKNATVTTLSPTLSGTRDDPDTGDYITGVQIQVTDPLAFLFEYDSTTTAGDPGTGKVRFNDSDPSTATAMYISETDYRGDSVVAGLLTSWTGAKLRTTDTFNEDYSYGTVGTVTDNGTYRTVAISSASGPDKGITDGNLVIIERDPSSVSMDSDPSNMWSSGAITVTGSPSTFSIVYGSVGSASALSGGTIYKWRAKTKDKGGEWSAQWSDWSFFTPNSAPNAPSVTIPSPANDITDDTPEFTITHSDPDPGDDKMYSYQMVIEKESSPGSGSWSSTGGWDSGQVDTSGSPATTKAVTSGTLAWGGSFRVKARTKDRNNSWSSYSSWQDFDLHATGVPITLAPANGDPVSATPTFTGSRASSTDTITSYQIVLYDDALSQLWDSGTISTGISSGSSFSKLYPGSPALSSGETYYWKARVTSSVGGTSSYSALQSFVVVDATTPTFTSPVGSGVSLTPTITFSRTASFDAARYDIFPSTSSESNPGTAVYSSGTLSSGIGAGGLGTEFSAAYGGSPALSYGTVYKIRAAVSSDGGSNWSSNAWTTFETDQAEAPVLTSVGGEAQTGTPWITDTTPDFVITRGGSDTIDQMRVRVLDAGGTVQVWDSGMTDVANSTTGTLTYSGTSLSRGTTYRWTASYKKSTGPTGPEAAPLPFRLNGLPSIPTELFPSPGYVFSDTDDIIFEAYFNDADVSGFADGPTEWEIVIQEIDETPVDTEVISSGLVVGLNSVEWPGVALSAGTDYQWRTRFKDTKSEWGPYSAWNSFRIATAPNGTISTPSDDSTITTVSPTVTWSYTGGTQLDYTIKIELMTVEDDTVVERTVTTISGTGTGTSKVITGGYLRDQRSYRLTLTVRNTDLLVDPTPSSVTVHALLDPPYPVEGISATVDADRSLITLDWDVNSLKAGHTFVAYYIYKRVYGDVEWQYVDSVGDRLTPTYDDWYAGHGIQYEYRVTAVTTKTGAGIELESPDDDEGGNITAVTMDTDVWMLIGYDRATVHIQELPVTDEAHNRPVQQEVFETLGSDRKVIIRGFVLGNEGTITCLWQPDLVASPDDEQVLYPETIIGRRLIDYITATAGPHILKSPFGDVWDVEFSGPAHKWIQAGYLEAVLNWIEVGTTSAVSV